MKKRLLMLLVSICLILVLVACAKPATPTTPTATPTAPVAPVVLKFDAWFPETSMEYRDIYSVWTKDVEKATNGRVTFQWYFAGALGPAPGAWDRLTTGVTDVANIIPGYTPGVFPLADIMELPYLGFPYSGGAEIASRIYWELNQKFPEMKSEYAKAKVLFLHTNSPSGFHTAKTPIRTLENFKGLKIRASGGEPAKTIQLLGASPVAMPVPDVYLAMEKGTVDGLNMSPGIFKAYKLLDVLRYHTLVPTNVMEMWIAINLNKWNALPADTRSAIEKLSSSYWQVAGKAFDAEVARQVTAIKDAGQEIIYPSAAEMQRWYDVIKAQRTDWAAARDAKGLPGKAVLEEALRLAKEYSK